MSLYRRKGEWTTTTTDGRLRNTSARNRDPPTCGSSRKCPIYIKSLSTITTRPSCRNSLGAAPTEVRDGVPSSASSMNPSCMPRSFIPGRKADLIGSQQGSRHLCNAPVSAATTSRSRRPAFPQKYGVIAIHGGLQHGITGAAVRLALTV